MSDNAVTRLFCRLRSINPITGKRALRFAANPDAKLRRVDPSQHNTRRHNQVEMLRKLRGRAGRKPNKPYYRRFP